MNIKEYYLRLIASIFLFLIGWGIIVPLIISNSKSELGIFLGILVAFFVPIGIYFLINPIITYFLNK